MVRSESVTFLCVTLSIFVGACGEGAPLRDRCEPLAVDGCPGNSLAVCADDACAFVASCDLATGRWVTVGACPRGATDAGAGDGAGDAGTLTDATAPTDASPDAAAREGGSSAGCPPLQLPDCSESTRAACGGGCCGCEDVFACVRGGWEYLGPCVSP
jgi:hypothetical protein